MSINEVRQLPVSEEAKAPTPVQYEDLCEIYNAALYLHGDHHLALEVLLNHCLENGHVVTEGAN